MSGPPPLLLRAAPAIFVFLWSTGWIAARAVAPYADPLTYLSARYACALVVLVAFAFLTGTRWPTLRRDWVHMLLNGVLGVGCYLGGVWYAVAHGVPAGVSGLIASVQPLLTALLAPVFLDERISARQWAGIALATAGIILVLQPKLASVAPGDLAEVAVALGFNLLGMLTIVLASIHQKKYLANVDLRALTPAQILGALAATLPIAMLTEPMRLEWNGATLAAMAWSVLVLSIAAGALYLMMIRAGAVSKVAALLYLVPLAVAIEAYLMFGETLTPLQIAGMVTTSVGVALAMRRA